MIKNIWLAALLFITQGLLSQQHPSNLRWMQTESEHFNLIYPIDYGINASRVISLLEKSYSAVGSQAGQKPQKTKIVIYNQTIVSNGFATLVPRMSGLYTTPPQDVSSSLEGSDWMQNLSIHEFRHITQYSVFNRGFTKLSGYLAGGIGKSLTMHWAIPVWYFEGDAVYTETKFSLGGRGRQPGFFRDIKALELNNTRYSYNKAFLGSYKNYIPNYYRLGYLMSSHINKNYGYDAWDKTIKRSAWHSYNPFAFSRNLKRNTGSNLRKTYSNTLNEYDSLWSNNTKDEIYSEYKLVKLPKKKVWTNYSFPHKTNNGSIVAFKSGLADASSVVSIIDGNEKRISSGCHREV
jgi:hypothetical protein